MHRPALFCLIMIPVFRETVKYYLQKNVELPRQADKVKPPLYLAAVFVKLLNFSAVFCIKSGFRGRLSPVLNVVEGGASYAEQPRAEPAESAEPESAEPAESAEPEGKPQAEPESEPEITAGICLMKLQISRTRFSGLSTVWKSAVPKRKESFIGLLPLFFSDSMPRVLPSLSRPVFSINFPIFKIPS